MFVCSINRSNSYIFLFVSFLLIISVGLQFVLEIVLTDLFTVTAAILNLLESGSITGCPGGTRSVFTRALRAKRELHCIFLGKKAIIITSKHGTTNFSYCNLFLGKRKDELARKARKY